MVLMHKTEGMGNPKSKPQAMWSVAWKL